MRAGEIAGTAAARLHREVDRADAILVGPGMVDPAGARGLLALYRRRDCTAALVLDAGALPVLGDARGPRLGERTILTPHAGEMAKLCTIERDEVLAQPQARACETVAPLGYLARELLAEIPAQLARCSPRRRGAK